MKVDAFDYVATVDGGGRRAQAAERFGYDGWFATETQTDGFLDCAVAAERTGSIEVATGIAVACARNPQSNPNVLLAAVGPLMTEVAGEVADGISCHSFTTERYLREVTLPALQRGAARSGRDLVGFEITAPGFVVARDTEEEIAAGID